MEDLLIKVLEEAFGYPVSLQGSYTPENKYPDHFFTFWNDNADGTSFYSNKEGAIVWVYSLNFYSNDPIKVNTMFKEVKDTPTAKSVLKANGFIVTGAGYSVMSDEVTHTGRGITVTYRQQS